MCDFDFDYGLYSDPEFDSQCDLNCDCVLFATMTLVVILNVIQIVASNDSDCNPVCDCGCVSICDFDFNSDFDLNI